MLKQGGQGHWPYQAGMRLTYGHMGRVQSSFQKTLCTQMSALSTLQLPGLLCFQESTEPKRRALPIVLHGHLQTDLSAKIADTVCDLARRPWDRWASTGLDIWRKVRAGPSQRHLAVLIILNSRTLVKGNKLKSQTLPQPPFIKLTGRANTL